MACRRGAFGTHAPGVSRLPAGVLGTRAPRGRTRRDQIKSATLGVERLEFEYTIPVADAEVMLARLCGTRVLAKTRHYVPAGAHTWEIDEFEGANAGLVAAEIELARADEPFVRPAWLGAEVSADPRYYNVCLLEHPYTQWA